MKDIKWKVWAFLETKDMLNYDETLKYVRKVVIFLYF